MPDQPSTPVTSDAPPFDPDYDTPRDNRANNIPPNVTPKQPTWRTEPAPGATNGTSPTYAATQPDVEPHSSVPQDYAAEQAVLGAMLLNPDHVIPAVAELITGTDYYRPVHERLHDTLIALHAAHQPIDSVTVADHLRTRGDLTNIGGAPYLHTLTTAAQLTSPGAAQAYATIVRTTARRRLLEQTGHRLTAVARTGDLTQLDNAFTQAYEALDTGVLAYGPAAHVTTSWSPVNLDRVLTGDYLDPPPIILRRLDGVPLLYAGAVHTISGESESGKTWLTLLAILQELADGNACTFIDFEDRADRVVARLLALGAHPDAIRERFAYVRPDRPLDDQGRAQLEPALTGRTLVILDGVTEAMTTHGLDLNSNADSATFQALLPRWIADHGPAVAMIDHVVKNKEEQGRFAIGAQHKLAGIDGAAYVVRNHQPFARGKRGISQVIVAKDRPGHVREQAHGKTIATFALDASGDGNVIVAELMPPTDKGSNTGDSFRPTVVMERVSRFVATNPKCSRNMIETSLRGKATITRTALEHLVLEGYVSTISGSRNAVQHVSVKPYFAPTDDDTDEPHDPHQTGDTHDE